MDKVKHRFVALSADKNPEITVCSELQEQLHNWLLDTAPVKSGQKTLRFLKFTTYLAAYSQFTLEKPDAVISQSHFRELLRYWRIRPRQHDQYACPYCEQADEHAFTPEQRREHADLLESTWKNYGRDIDGLPALVTSPSRDYVIVLMDYCRIHELRNAAAVDGKSEPRKLSVFNITLVRSRDSQTCYDHLSFDRQGYEFMNTSFDKFAIAFDALGLVNVKEVRIWSDGGLRNYGSMVALSSLAQKIQKVVKVSFFAPYHGHSRCDAHFGRGKLTLRRKYPTGGLLRATQVADVFSEAGAETVILDPQESVEPKLFQKWKSDKGENEGVRHYNRFELDGISIKAIKLNNGAILKTHTKQVPLLKENTSSRAASKISKNGSHLSASGSNWHVYESPASSSLSHRQSGLSSSGIRPPALSRSISNVRHLGVHSSSLAIFQTPSQLQGVLPTVRTIVQSHRQPDMWSSQSVLPETQNPANRQ